MDYNNKNSMIYLLTAVGLTPSGNNTVHIYTQTIHRTTQLTILVGRLSGIRTQIGQTNWEECGPCPVFVSYTLTFGLQLREKHKKKIPQSRLPKSAIWHDENRIYRTEHTWKNCYTLIHFTLWKSTLVTCELSTVSQDLYYSGTLI
jgi:hypothetical protein